MKSIEDNPPQPEPLLEFNRAFARQVLLTEQWRVKFLAAVCVLVFIVLAIAAYVPGTSGAFQPVMRRAFPLASALLAGAVLYELGVAAILRRLAARGLLLPPWLQYLNAIVDTSIPTIATMIGARVMPPLEVLHGNQAQLYFLIIILSALQLRFRLCLFTGAVAAVEYWIISVTLLTAAARRGDSGDPFLYNLGHHAGKGGLYLVAGLAAGILAVQVRRQFENALRSLQERDRAVSIFGLHVSPAVAAKLLHQPIDPGGEARAVCVMFLDIRGFTAFSEARPAAEVMAYLNTLFAPLIDVVNREGGIINKFLGDGFMAVFGAPAGDGMDARFAVSAAQQILAIVARMNDSGAIPPTRLGIGLHAGEAITGNVGSSTRQEYTIIGNVVNLASRVEACNKQFGSQLLLTDAVWSRLNDDLAARPAATDLGHVTIRGQDAPVRLYQLA